MSGFIVRRSAPGARETFHRKVEVRCNSIAEMIVGDEVVTVFPGKFVGDRMQRSYVEVLRVIELTQAESDLVRQAIEYGRATGGR